MKTPETIEHAHDFFILIITVPHDIIAQVYLTLSENENICDFEGILKTECNLQHLTRNCRIKNLDDFERDEADAYLQREGLLNRKEKGMTIRYIMDRCLVMFLRGEKVDVAQY